jgi:hypothetical protein
LSREVRWDRVGHASCGSLCLSVSLVGWCYVGFAVLCCAVLCRAVLQYGKALRWERRRLVACCYCGRASHLFYCFAYNNLCMQYTLVTP